MDNKENKTNENKTNEIKNNKIEPKILDMSMNPVNYVTLEYMVNSDHYEKYLKKNKMDHDNVLKKEKKFYKKRIISITKELLHNDIKDETLINAFNTFAKSCIMYFKFKDKSDIIQEDYIDLSFNNNKNITSTINSDFLLSTFELGKKNNLEPILEEDKNNSDELNDSNNDSDDDYLEYNNNDNNDNNNHSYNNKKINKIKHFNFNENSLHNYNSLDKANQIFLSSTVESKVLTLDNFVIKKNKPKNEMIIPKSKEIDLTDPKFKKKDIKFKKEKNDEKLDKNNKNDKTDKNNKNDKIDKISKNTNDSSQIIITSINKVSIDNQKSTDYEKTTDYEK